MQTFYIIQEIFNNNFDDTLIPEKAKAHIIDVVNNQDGQKTIFVEEEATLSYLLVCESAKVDLTIVNQGAHSQVKIYCIFIGNEAGAIDATVTSELAASNAESDVYMLSLLGDKSNIHVDGKVNIKPDIQKASGNLMEENLILGEKIKIKTLPMLDVRSNDVTASHGCRIDKVDEKKLFYMTSRGIEKEEANRLIVEGYIENILEQFSLIDEDKVAKLKSDIVGKVI